MQEFVSASQERRRVYRNLVVILVGIILIITGIMKWPSSFIDAQKIEVVAPSEVWSGGSPRIDVKVTNRRTGKPIEGAKVELHVRGGMQSPWSIREQQTGENYACLFFDTESGQCRIYPVRPRQCRSFPFWDCFKQHPEKALEECPGVIMDPKALRLND